MAKKTHIILIWFLLIPSNTSNLKPRCPNTEKQSEHYLVSWNAWQSLSVLGILGTFSNSLLIYTFYSEPNMATSVNAMIFMDTLYRLLYANIIHWRTYNMVHETTMLSAWLSREEV